MIKTILVLLVGILMLLISLPFAVVIWIFQKKNKYEAPSRAGVWGIQTMSKIFCRLAGCRFTIEGQENIPDSPAIFVGNHQGNFDAFLAMFALGDPKVTMTKIEAKAIPVANIWMSIIKVIFVDRKNPGRAIAAMKESEDFLRHGRSLLYFAEGTRSQGPDMGPFKGGAFKTAVATGTQIVPFVIDGTYKVFEQQGYLKSADVVLHILPPVPVSTEDVPRELSDKIQKMIQEELDRIRGTIQA